MSMALAYRQRHRLIDRKFQQSLTGHMDLAAALVTTWTAVPAPAPTPAPIAAPLPPPASAPITAPRAAPPPTFVAVLAPRDLPETS